MKTYINPNPENWEALCERPLINSDEIETIVSEIIEEVKANGDKALLKYAEKFDTCKLGSFIVTESEIKEADELVPEELKNAISIAKRNIEKFHKSQLKEEPIVETSSGVTCWRKSIGIEKVGLYVPGGTAPLFSTVLMLGIPAILAECKEIILCTPPNTDGRIAPEILYTAQSVGIKKILKSGGAQAIAAMAFGTESVPQVYKIFGPGNQFVTKAKQLIQQKGVAIDMPAGPSEVLVIADATCNPAFVASDLLSQAEHGEDSQVVLVCTEETLVQKIQKEVTNQIEKLPRKETAKKALDNSFSVILKNIEDCFSFSNQYAPEHLIVATQKAEDYASLIINAGSVFLGNYSCESAGDYASGTNHTLPTNGYARNYSGVSVDSFCKKITFQKITKKGIKNLGPTIETMAAAEGLDAHKNAVTIRLKSLGL